MTLLPFKPCKNIGLYPIVDSSAWLEQLLPQGVRCIQLRIKEGSMEQLKAEIKHSIALAKKYGAILFINDHWELAIDLGADGVHLGQEDLIEANIQHIQQAGLYLGLSAYSDLEVIQAKTLNPSYIACGPVYATTSKNMPVPPQGLVQLQAWRNLISCPMVAIGGINLERLPDILKIGLEGIALISAITEADNPIVATQQFLAAMKTLIRSA